MRYGKVVQAEFLSRPNRFLAVCRLLQGELVTAHVRNTGRCRELLLPGATVYLEQAEKNPARKTSCSLVTVQKGDRLINLDSQAPNAVLWEALRAGRDLLPHLPPITKLRREAVYRTSRFDFQGQAVEIPFFLEAKGVTLEQDGEVLFPDAPTQRGIKHIQELLEAKRAGYRAFLFFVVQMEGVRRFCPNRQTHPAFGEALKQAEQEGVTLLAYDCRVTPQEVTLNQPVPICL